MFFNTIMLTVLVIITIISIITFYSYDRGDKGITIQKDEIELSNLLDMISKAFYRTEMEYAEELISKHIKKI